MIRYFTSESVTEGHPDKVCDIVSDSVLDAILKEDENARVACECVANGNFMLIVGEVTTSAEIDIDAIARRAVKEIGYSSDEYGFNADTMTVKVDLKKQSADIALGVDNAKEYKESGDRLDRIGAGDQGMMFGYACRETEELMPVAIMLSHRLCKRLAQVRKQGVLPYLRPDGKAQVTVKYSNGVFSGIDAIVVSAQHDGGVDIETLRKDIEREVISAVIPQKYIDGDTKIYINPTGNFVIGGPVGDSGLTGRKIIVDTYGGYCPHGGGCFSGKDPTKVDRSAAYMARYAAKNVVSSGLSDEVRIEVAYAIGVASPISVTVDTFGTGKLPDDELAKIIRKEFDFRPLAIIEKLGLRRPIYSKTASYGHFGRSEFPWEKTDKADDLKKYLQ